MLGENTNEYSLTLTVPNQVMHDFDVNVKLDHGQAKKPKIMLLTFKADGVNPRRTNVQADQ